MGDETYGSANISRKAIRLLVGLVGKKNQLHQPAWSFKLHPGEGGKLPADQTHSRVVCAMSNGTLSKSAMSMRFRACRAGPCKPCRSVQCMQGSVQIRADPLVHTTSSAERGHVSAARLARARPSRSKRLTSCESRCSVTTSCGCVVTTSSTSLYTHRYWLLLI